MHRCAFCLRSPVLVLLLFVKHSIVVRQKALTRRVLFYSFQFLSAQAARQPAPSVFINYSATSPKEFSILLLLSSGWENERRATTGKSTAPASNITAALLETKLGKLQRKQCFFLQPGLSRRKIVHELSVELWRATRRTGNHSHLFIVINYNFLSKQKVNLCFVYHRPPTLFANQLPKSHLQLNSAT